MDQIGSYILVVFGLIVIIMYLGDKLAPSSTFFDNLGGFTLYLVVIGAPAYAIAWIIYKWYLFSGCKIVIQMQ